jgi:hypothetical protein
LHDIHETASLIPYLETDGTRFHVKLSVGTQDDVFPQKTAFPFLVISESRPLARIIEAKILTDAGTQIEPVFLLIQKDEYPLTEDELLPLDNGTIDQYWQHTYNFHSHEKSESSPLILKDQIAENETLLPFHPLLFCKFKQTYFHPLCPDCGALLQQCYNDTILQEYGLQPYSGSLKRYLFCPSCIVSKEKSDFYVSSLATNDPAFLKDRFELIQNFGRLIGHEKCAGLMPCIGCNEHQECYGHNSLAPSRITPLSFYPFYMLMFKSDSINAADFLSLISGSSFKELENRLLKKQQPGRRNRLKFLKDKQSIETPFFFQNEDRFFLEVLYLKLSFLGELAKGILYRLDTIQYPEFGFSMDKIWVKLSDQNCLLPGFWNFKIELLDVIGADVQSLLSPQLSQSYGLHLLGTIWFHTLLVNGKQDVSRVFHMTRKALEEIDAKDETTFENFLEDAANQNFSPENIFWNPDIMTVKKDWYPFWKASLLLGFHFFENSRHGPGDGSMETFESHLEQLRQQIKDNLFSTEPSVPVKDSKQDDAVIYNILKKILSNRQESIESPSDIFTETIISTETVDTEYDDKVQDDKDDVDIYKTVILSPDGEMPEKPIGLEQEEDLDETIIIQKSDPDKIPILTPERPDTENVSQTPDDTYEDMEETVILSPDDFGQNHEPSFQPEADDLPETVIISPDQSVSGYPETPSGPPFQGIGSEHTEKGGQVPVETKTGDNQKAKKPDPNDFLEETILIQPGKIGPEKKEDDT